MWVTGLSLFSSLLKIVVLGSSGCEWLGLLCFQACWKWLCLALQRVSDWACFIFKPAENDLSLALQWVGDWACFILKSAKNGCPWFSREWVTELALFLSLLKVVVLGSPGCEWLSLLFYKLAENGCLWLTSQWVTELALLSSPLKMVVFGSLVGEWIGLLYFQACWRWWSLALQEVSDWGILCFQAC